MLFVCFFLRLEPVGTIFLFVFEQYFNLYSIKSLELHTACKLRGMLHLYIKEYIHRGSPY